MLIILSSVAMPHIVPQFRVVVREIWDQRIEVTRKTALFEAVEYAILSVQLENMK